MNDPRHSPSATWLTELLGNPRIAQLLRDADQASSLLARDPSGVSSADVREALASIHRDLGRELHTLVAERGPTQEPIPTPEEPPSFGPGDASTVLPTAPATLAPLASSRDPLYDDDWYTDEAAGAGPLFADDDLSDEHTDVPEADDEDTGRPVTAEVGPVGEVVSLNALVADSEDPDGELSALRAHERPAWARELADLLDLVALPDDLVDPGVLPDEASKVQWASGEVDHRLPRFPQRVQLALIGLLAARARNVQAHLDLDIGPRMAVDRLRRYRELNDLPWVVGITPGPGPETTSWADDAEAYWLLLRPPPA